MSGLLLILLGSAVLSLFALRFRRTAGDIDRPDNPPRTGTRLDLLLAGFPALSGAAPFVHPSSTVDERL